MGADAQQLLERALHQAKGGLLAEVCAAAASAPLPQVPHPTANLDLGWGPPLADVQVEGSGSRGAGEARAVCELLQHIYGGQCFREWWTSRERARAPDRLQWMQFRFL